MKMIFDKPMTPAQLTARWRKKHKGKKEYEEMRKKNIDKYHKSEAFKNCLKRYRLGESYKNHLKKRNKSETYLKYQREYEHSEKRRAYRNKPLNKFKACTLSLVGMAFRNKGFRKGFKTEQIVGCDWITLNKWIEKQFDKKMNWKNRGTYWEIDHYIPLNFAKNRKQLIKLCHYSNLRPLGKSENAKKRDILPPDLNEKLQELNFFES